MIYRTMLGQQDDQPSVDFHFPKTKYLLFIKGHSNESAILECDHLQVVSREGGKLRCHFLNPS
jgi:hypothetical protein